MGNFDNAKYDFNKDWDRSMREAFSDLSKDYPNSQIWINYMDGGSPSVRAKEIRLAPPDGQTDVVRVDLDLSRHFGTLTYGYHCIVFSEGIIDYEGTTGSTYTLWSDGVQIGQGDGRSMTRYTWKRRDGTTKFRSVETIDPANWMSKLNDDLYLSQLTIPGTHNTHALVGTVLMPNRDKGAAGATLDEFMNLYARARKIAECQDIDIKTQLERGVRYLDLRYGDGLVMRHGQLELPGTLVDCMKVVHNFLVDHPRETVIVMAKWDVWGFPFNGGYNEPDEARDAANKVFTEVTNRFVDFKTIPQLRDCRGKILRKLEGARGNHGLDFDKFKRTEDKFKQPAFTWPEYKIDNLLDAQQNEWAERMWRLQGSWARVEATLKWIKKVRPEANKAEVWDNTGLNDTEADFARIFTHTTIFPSDFAHYSNDQLYKWLQSTCSLAQRYELGILQLDFAGSRGQDLLTKLILTNFT